MSDHDVHRTGEPLIPSHELIIRIDERTRNMKTTLDSVETRVGALEKTVGELGPIKMIVFGGVGLILVAVLGALLTYAVYTPSREVIREVPAISK